MDDKVESRLDRPVVDVEVSTERIAKGALVTIILGLAGFVVGYRLLVFQNLEQTAALFIGLPTFLAIMVVLAPRSKSVTGLLLKLSTLALLLSATLLQEGFVCVLMAAPLFYGVAVFVGLLLDWSTGRGLFRSWYDRGARVTVAFLPLLTMSAEGTSEWFSFEREESVTVTQVLSMTPSEVESALARTPQYDAQLPFYLRLGFPRPVATDGAGLDVGDTRRIHFAGGEGNPGDLVLVVAERDADRVRFEVLENTSHIAHWLLWRGSEVRWSEHPDGAKVTWTERWRRDLDPYWYFAPAQRYAMTRAIRANLEQLERR